MNMYQTIVSKINQHNKTHPRLIFKRFCIHLICFCCPITVTNGMLQIVTSGMLQTDKCNVTKCDKCNVTNCDKCNVTNCDKCSVTN